MLSTAISDEIYSKTLGLLMTTLIGSFQIVFGKLLQRVLLLAITLPPLLLFWARVFVRKVALRQATGQQPQVRRTWGWLEALASFCNLCDGQVNHPQTGV